MIGDAEHNVPLAPWTSIRAGGSADLLARPKSIDSLLSILKHAHAENIPLTILGGGNNTLVGDFGIPGITLKLNNDYFPEERDGTILTLNAGSSISRLITLMKQAHLVGAEFLAGIPGTIGGATAMNAGTKNGECMTIVQSVELATHEGIGWVSGLHYRYRHTDLPKDALVTRVKFTLREGDLAESKVKMEKDLGYRKTTQPLSQPNFGSVFTNPQPQFAGALIESVGLKGHRIGNAQISEKHANWIVNLGNCTAADVTHLMTEAENRVFAASGVRLHPEVKRIGRFTADDRP